MPSSRLKSHLWLIAVTMPLLSACDALEEPPAISFRVQTVIFERLDFAGPAGKGWDTGQGDPHYDDKTDPDVFALFGAEAGPYDFTHPVSISPRPTSAEYGLPYTYNIGSFVDLDAKKPFRVQMRDCDRMNSAGVSCLASELMTEWTLDPQEMKGKTRHTLQNDKYAVTLVLSNWTYER